MRGTGGRLPLAGAALLLMAGCATSEEWATWKQNPAHFASADHFKFSMKNAPGASPRVSREALRAGGGRTGGGGPSRLGREGVLGPSPRRATPWLPLMTRGAASDG